MTEVVVRTLIAEVAMLAGYYSLRLMFVFFRDRRRHIASHAMWMNCALFITAGVIVSRMLVRGSQSISNYDVILASQAGFLVAGLRPVWQNTRKRKQAKERT